LGDTNVVKNAAKMLKYKHITIETQRRWNSKIKAIPVIIGATGTI
jgi:hypothetical protein